MRVWLLYRDAIGVFFCNEKSGTACDNDMMLVSVLLFDDVIVSTRYDEARETSGVEEVQDTCPGSDGKSFVFRASLFR